MSVSAHGDGASYEETIGNYFVDIGYDPVVPTAGEIIRFDFSVEDQESTSTAKIFTDVWVRIMYDNAVQFSGGIHRPVFGPTGFAYVPYEAGTYTVFARFQNESEKIVETEFDVVVVSDSESDESTFVTIVPYVFVCLFGILIGAFSVVVMRRVR